MKKVYISIVCLLLAAALTGLCAAMQREQQALAEKIIRLHVVAASDSPEDQRIKLLVRDAVLHEAEAALSSGMAPEDALRGSLLEIEQAANAALRKAGAEQRAQVKLQKELFSTREYEIFRLPAGTYRTLRVTIGEGQGHNWWCVVYPALCLAASSEELQNAAQAAGLTQGEVSLITEEGDGVELEFWTLEVLAKIKNFFKDA